MAAAAGASSIPLKAHVLCLYAEGVTDGASGGLVRAIDPLMEKTRRVATVVMNKISTKEGMSEEIKKGGPICDVLVIFAHGCNSHFRLKGGEIEEEEEEKKEAVCVREKDIGFIFKGLKPSAQIFMISCSTANKGYQSIAYKISKVTGNVVFAPIKKLFPKDLHLNPLFGKEKQPLYYIRSVGEDRLGVPRKGVSIHRLFYLTQFQSEDEKEEKKLCRYAPTHYLGVEDADRILSTLPKSEIRVFLRDLLEKGKETQALNIAKALQTRGNIRDLFTVFEESGKVKMAADLLSAIDPSHAYTLLSKVISN